MPFSREHDNATDTQSADAARLPVQKKKNDRINTRKIVDWLRLQYGPLGGDKCRPGGGDAFQDF
jgi:hypothetical protein